MLARAPSVGGTFVEIFSNTTVGGSPGGTTGLIGVDYNPLVPESVAWIGREHSGGDVYQAHIGSGSSFSNGATGVHGSGAGDQSGVGLSYGLGKWLVAGYFARWQVLS